MFGPFRKEKPFQGFMGFGGGATNLMQSAAAVGKFTIDGSNERPAADGYSTPSPTRIGGSHFSLEVTSGPFVATVKLWGGGGGVGGPEGGCGGQGGYTQADFEFINGEQYEFVRGGGGHVAGQGTQPYGGGGQGTKISPNPSGAGGGGGGYSGMFKAPAPTPAANTRAQEYAVLIAGGGGGDGGQAGEAGAPGNFHLPSKGGAGGGAKPPAAPPFATNFGGGRDPGEPNPTRIDGQPGRGNGGGQGGPAPTTNAASANPYFPGGGYGGSRDGAYPGPSGPTTYGFGTALTGGNGVNAGGGGSGGGGGYWGGGGSGTPTNPKTGGGGGGGGFITTPTVHPEGIGAVAPFVGVCGFINPVQGPAFTPQPSTPDRYDPTMHVLYAGANYSDPDWEGDLPTGAGAGNAGIFGGPNYGDGTWNDANAGGWSGRVVIKQAS
jgi:hypothetical protein